MLPDVFALLLASPAVVALLGSNPTRAWRHGQAPQDPPFDDYVTWFVVSGIPENHLNGTPPTDRTSVQVDCWGMTDDGVEALAVAVRDAIEPYAHQTGFFSDNRSTESKRYRISMTFDFWQARAT